MLDITSRLLRFVYEVFKRGASASALSRKAEQRDAVASKVCKQVCHLMAVSLTQLAPCAVLLQIERRFILHTLKIEPYTQAHAIARHKDALHLDPISGAVFVSGAQRLDNIASQFAKATLSEEDRQALVKEYTAEYYRIRREQLRFIIENKASLAAVYALYQRLPGDTYLFNGDSDVVYYRTVAEAIEQTYPESPYLQSLMGEIARMDARISLSSQITEAGYPDLELSDIYGKKVRLSSLAGKVVLLDFWSAELGNSNTLNAELKEVYKKYADAPVAFEVYQVAIDTSKPLWISAVQEQQLPWVSVSDLRGRASSSLGLYNVQKLPANFLIDKEGNIVGKDIYGKSLEQKLDELTR